MSDGTKLLLAFLGGAMAGAAGLAALNRNKLDFGHVKPMLTDLMGKGMVMKDAVMTKVEALKEDIEDMAADARDKVDQERLRENFADAASQPEK